jgi:O-antigen/teichoic acid export membrane protein
MFRILNVLSNAVVGIILARQLDLSDRGHVAVITSIIGVAVVVISSPRGEEILRSRGEFGDSIKTKTISLNMVYCIFVLIVSLGWMYRVGDVKLSPIGIILICALIVASSLNSLEQAILFLKFKSLGNQLIMTFHAMVLLAFLGILFLNLAPGIEAWLWAFLMAEILLLTALHKLNTDTRIVINWQIRFKNIKLVDVEKRPKFEIVSVYQGAFFLQILTILVSVSLPVESIAFFAIGMTLTSLMSLPIVPFLPQILSESDEVAKLFRRLSVRRIFLTLFLIIIYVYILMYLYQFLIPMFYGQKYSPLVNAVPMIVMSGLMLGVLNVVSTIFRGSRNFLASVIVYSLAITLFGFELVIFGDSIVEIRQLFTYLFFSLAIPVFAGGILLFSTKKFSLQS